MGEVFVKNDTANHDTRSRIASWPWRSRRRASWATRSSPARPPGTWRMPWPRTPRRRVGSLRLHPVRPRGAEGARHGVYGTNLVAVRGNYDDVNRLCTELSGDQRLGVRQREPAALLRQGSKTIAFEIAEQLGFELPDRVVAPIASGSLFTKIARGFQEWLDIGLWRDRCPPSTARRRTGARPLPARSRRARLLPPSQAGHDRQVARRRKPGGRAVRARAGAALWGSIDSVSDDEIREGIRSWPDHGHLHRDRRRRDDRGAAQAGRERGDLGSDDRVVAVITGDGLKTLDAVRGGSRPTRSSRPSIPSSRARGRRRRRCVICRCRWR